MARVCGLLTLLFLSCFLLWPGTLLSDDAHDCVEDIAHAIDTADVELFKARVDVDRVIEDAISVFLREANKPYLRKNLEPMLVIMLQQAASNEGAGQAIRQLLLKESRAFILNGID